MLGRAGIADIAGRKVGSCSGGQQQRLRFALALLPDPDLIVLDEPTTGMDVEGRREFWTALRVQARARGALADVRGMVSATRAVTLAGELAGARQAFDAAGVQAQVPGSVDDVPERLRELFAWALREGTTNVVRHAAASRVEVTMTADSLVVDDDGHGPSGGSGGEPTAPGNGLHGLTERARAARARVEVSTSPLGGYRLAVIARNEGR